MYDFCSMITALYYKNITNENVCAGFRRIGLYQYDPSSLIQTSPPLRNDDVSRIISVQELKLLVKKKLK